MCGHGTHALAKVPGHGVGDVSPARGYHILVGRVARARPVAVVVDDQEAADGEARRERRELGGRAAVKVGIEAQQRNLRGVCEGHGRQRVLDLAVWRTRAQHTEHSRNQ